MAKPLEYNATLVERVDLTDALAVFRVKPDSAPSPTPWFVPGQYCVLGLNNEKNPDLGSVRRAMSIASSPARADIIEFYIRYVSKPESDNPLTHLLWDLPAGGRMYMRTNPTGKFTIQDTGGSERTCIMVAAGTGAAPFVAIVRDALDRDPEADLSKFVLLHAASYAPDLGYREELEALRERNGLHYFGSISRPAEGDGWSGHTGRVEDFFLPDRLSALESAIGTALTPQNAYVMVCGLTGTVGMCIRRLIGRGFLPDNRRIRKAMLVDESIPASLYYEQYDKTPPVDVKEPAVVEQLRQDYAKSAST